MMCHRAKKRRLRIVIIKEKNEIEIEEEKRDDKEKPINPILIENKQAWESN